MKPKEIERQFATGERIVARGSATRELYLIKSGEVRIGDGPGAQPLLLGPGDMFGELVAILGEPHANDVFADGDVSLLALDLELLNRLCASCPEFAFRLIRHLAQRIASPDPTPTQAPRTEPGNPAVARLCATLLERAVDEEGTLRGPSALRDLAAAAELSIPDAYRAVQQLLEQRALRLADDVLTILDREAIAVLS